MAVSLKVPQAQLHSVAVTKDHPEALDLIVNIKGDPSDYNNGKFQLKATLVCGDALLKDNLQNWDIHNISNTIANQHEILAFLCGGPGDANDPFKNTKINKRYHGQYLILYLNYRGTTMEYSSVHKRMMNAKTGQELKKEDFLRLSQRHIMLDYEALRLCLGGKKWAAFGQSFGGFLGTSTVSHFPNSWYAFLNTGGLPALLRGPVEANHALFQLLIRRVDHFYSEKDKGKDAIKNVRKIALWLAQKESQGNKVRLTGSESGYLTAQRFLCIGRFLGSEESKRALYYGLFSKMANDINDYDELQPDTQEEYSSLDTWKFSKRPLYALMSDHQYYNPKDPRAGWAPKRAIERALENKEPWAKNYRWVLCKTAVEMVAELRKNPKVYMSGEMVYDFFFDTHDILIPYKELAHELAEHEWEGELYDSAALKRNEVPIFALVMEKDIYVDPVASIATAEFVKNMHYKVYDGEHGSIRAHPDEVLDIMGEMMNTPAAKEQIQKVKNYQYKY
ncbi:hypothetical protein F4778DRAFT_734481 [Xylariomycetidae sp. FL2044]|nr:hypothetical protein F4778DRAFT_734481 [Xylariomycetidae sp. FL2044]